MSNPTIAQRPVRKARSVTRVVGSIADIAVKSVSLVEAGVNSSVNIMRSVDELANASYYLCNELAIEAQLDAIRNLGELAGMSEEDIQTKCVKALS